MRARVVRAETWRGHGWEYKVVVWREFGSYGSGRPGSSGRPGGSWRVVKCFLVREWAEQYAEALRLGLEPRDCREVGLADTA